MKYGDDIRMLRDYAHLKAGRVIVAGDDVTLGVARALCAGDEPFAEPVESGDIEGEEGDSGTR